MNNFEYIKKLDKKGLAEFLYYDVIGPEEPCFICGLCDKCKQTDGDVDCLDGIKKFLDDKHSF